MAKLFVYGVDPSCPRETLEGEFGQCGEVTDVYNTEKGYAFVKYHGLNIEYNARFGIYCI